MVDIGKKNRLIVKQRLDDGFCLDGGKSGDIFLPKKGIPEHVQTGDEIEVFVYVNKEEKLEATTRKPYAEVGKFAYLRVVANSSAGAHLDWGLPKDLLVPKKLQRTKMKDGSLYIVYVFLDTRTNRIAASTKLNTYLGLTPPGYAVGEEVDVLIGEKTDLGYKGIINNAHWGMIYDNEVFQPILIGQRVKGYIRQIREDGKIDITLQPSGYHHIDEISRTILKTIENMGGKSSVTDKSSPQEIYVHFRVSKKVFKKAIGTLYKKRLIALTSDEITLLDKCSSRNVN